jgi:hypothetical protein
MACSKATAKGTYGRSGSRNPMSFPDRAKTYVIEVQAKKNVMYIQRRILLARFFQDWNESFQD